jgi:hypothetical protein
MRAFAAGFAAAAGLTLAGCDDTTSPDARFPFVEGIYDVRTTIVQNSCRQFSVRAGDQIFVFIQDGRRIEFTPPGLNEDGEVVLLELGIVGEVDPDGTFEVQGAYTLSPGGVGSGIVVQVTMEGRFDGALLEGTQHQLAAFPGGSCEVTFSFAGAEG